MRANKVMRARVRAYDGSPSLHNHIRAHTRQPSRIGADHSTHQTSCRRSRACTPSTPTPLPHEHAQGPHHTHSHANYGGSVEGPIRSHAACTLFSSQATAHSLLRSTQSRNILQQGSDWKMDRWPSPRMTPFCNTGPTAVMEEVRIGSYR